MNIQTRYGKCIVCNGTGQELRPDISNSISPFGKCSTCKGTGKYPYTLVGE
ncbi:MAG: molecular chaperone DnaJ [Candidatus Aenigmarchaeota archaeon]|nr:molecular chaperone DnaJ [Candidatus Aenigmarchaeota archaeon]